MEKKQRQTAVKKQTTQAQAPVSKTTVIATILLVLYTGYFTASSFLRNSIYLNPVTLWKSAVQSAPDKRRTHENYGQALSTAGLLHEALTQFKTVLALPDDGSVPLRDVHREIGVVYFRLGLIDESIVAWKKGLEYAYMDPGLLNNLSIALLKQHRLDEALSYAAMAVKVNPYMPEPANSLGEIYMAKGEFGKAAEQFLVFLQLRPEDTRGYWNAALAYDRAGDHEKALRFASQFLAMETDPRYQQQAKQLVDGIKEKLKTGRKKG